jgi:hypothetical protein
MIVYLNICYRQLRHTYLRVLHPLLTKTQLRSLPYKRPQIVAALESLIQNASIRDINPTTKRLVERCLSGEWCVQLKTSKHERRVGSPTSESAASAAHALENLFASAEPSMTTAINLERSTSISGKSKALKTSKSMEFKKDKAHHQKPVRSPVERIRRPSNSNSGLLSLNGGATVSVPTSPLPRKCNSADVDGSFGVTTIRHHPFQTHPMPQQSRPPIASPSISITSTASQEHVSPPAEQSRSRRPAPPAPTKRRQPPTIPSARTNGDASITTIRSSARSPLSA